MSLILKPVQTQQPSTGTGLTDKFGTVYTAVPFLQPATISAGITNGADRYGRFFSYPTSGTDSISYGNYAAQDIFYQSPGWMMLVWSPGPASSGPVLQMVANKSDNHIQSGWTLYLISTTSTLTFVMCGSSVDRAYSGAFTLTNNATYTIIVNAGVFGSTAGLDEGIWVNGVQIGSNTNAGSGTHASDATFPLQLGSGTFTSVQRSVGRYYLAAFGRKLLTSQEIKTLSANPWQIFAPPQRKLWVNAVSSSFNQSLTGTSATTPTITRKLTKLQSVAATSAIVASILTSFVYKRTLAAASATVATLGKALQAVRTATSAATATLSRHATLARTMVAAVASLASLHGSSQLLTAASAATAKFVKKIYKLLWVE